MKFLLSKRNFQTECQEWWGSCPPQLVTLRSSNGVGRRVCLLKLSVLSGLVRDLKKSMEVPDSLLHLLDIDIVLPDFSDNVLDILCNVVKGVDPDELINIASFTELQDLVEVLRLTLSPSLIRVEVNESQIPANDVNCNQFEEEGLESEQMAVKTEPIMINEDYENLDRDLAEADENVDKKPHSGLDMSTLGNSPACDTPYNPVSVVKMRMTLDPLDKKKLKQIWEVFVSFRYEEDKKVWFCTLCEYQTPYKHNVFTHIDGHHTPHISHQCLLCPFITNTQYNLYLHVAKKHCDEHSPKGQSNNTHSKNTPIKKNVAVDTVEDHKEPKAHKCFFCTFKSSSLPGIRRHIARKHHCVPGVNRHTHDPAKELISATELLETCYKPEPESEDSIQVELDVTGWKTSNECYVCGTAVNDRSRNTHYATRHFWNQLSKEYAATLETKPSVICPYDNCQIDISQKSDEGDGFFHLKFFLHVGSDHDEFSTMISTFLKSRPVSSSPPAASEGILPVLLSSSSSRPCNLRLTDNLISGVRALSKDSESDGDSSRTSRKGPL